MAKKDILISTRQIVGGTKTSGTYVMEPQAELTAASKKGLGLSTADIDDLVAKGALISVPAHVSEDGGASGQAQLAAEKARADQAEKDLAEANRKIDVLSKELAEASAPDKAKG